jgi:hypothetical protein
MVCDAYRFDAVGSSFFRFMVQHADELEVPIHHIILVGHNSRVFDVPFLAQHFCNYTIYEEFFGDNRFRFGLDTMRIAKQAVSRNPSTNGLHPPAYNLRDLHTFVTGKCYENTPRAMVV